MKAITKAVTIFSVVLVSAVASTSFGACKQNTTRTGRFAYTVASSSTKLAKVQTQQVAVKSNSTVR